MMQNATTDNAERTLSRTALHSRSF